MIYRYTTKNTYGETVDVLDSWPQNIKDMWVNLLTADGYIALQEAWHPTYEFGTVSWPGNTGMLVQIPTTSLQFSTRATADKLAFLYAIGGIPLTIVEAPFLDPGPDGSSVTQRSFKFPNGKTLPVYQLANYYTFNPDNINKVADTLCKQLIARVWP